MSLVGPDRRKRQRAGSRRPGAAAHGCFVARRVTLGLFVLPRLTRWVDKLPISQGLTAFVLVTMLLYAWAAEALGMMAAITGAFLGRIVLSSRSALHERIEALISVIAYGFFVPIFFVNVRLIANLRGARWPGPGISDGNDRGCRYQQDPGRGSGRTASWD